MQARMINLQTSRKLFYWLMISNPVKTLLLFIPASRTWSFLRAVGPAMPYGPEAGPGQSKLAMPKNYDVE